MRARVAGLLYLAVCILGPIRLAYIPSALFVSGNAAATAHNIASHEGLLRVGILSDLAVATIEIFLVITLYRLLSDVNALWAATMFVLGLMDVPIYFMNTLNDFGALLFAQGSDFVSVFEQPQRDAITMLFLTFHRYGTTINDVFFGLWLIPLSMLVYRSGFLPRVLGVWLALNGLAYLAESISGLMFAQHAASVANIIVPLQLGEVAFALWLLVVGVRQKPIAATA
jgi:hypothetical protein